MILLLFSISLLFAVLGRKDEPASLHFGEQKEATTIRIHSSSHRLLSDGNKHDGEEDDEEDWWDTLWDGNGDGDNEDEEDEDEEDKAHAGYPPQGGRPGNDDNHYDCQSMMNYLDQLPPECEPWRPNRPVNNPTTAPTKSPITDNNAPNNNDPDDDDTVPLDDILVPMSFRVGVRKKLKRRQVFRLRRAVAKTVSRILQRKSPFHVPRPFWDDSIMDYFYGDDSDDEDTTIPTRSPSPQPGSDGRPTWGDNRPSSPQNGPDGGPNWGHNNNGGRPVDGRPPMGSGGWREPRSIDPDAYSNEIPDDESNNNKARGSSSTHKKGKVWLHHYTTDLFDEVTKNETTGRWYYPVEVNYLVFWNVLTYLIDDPQVLADVTRICWDIGNKTLANGELAQALVAQIKNDTLFDAIDSIFDFDDEEDHWTDGEDIVDLDGQGQSQGDDIQATDLSGDGIFSTFPARLAASSSWGKREYFGLYLMIFTLVFAGVMRYGASRNKRHDSNKAQLSPNRDIHFLTEEGVNEFLQVGWNYQKQSTGDASQLYLNVYDKSGVGYAEDNSMLMGGVEQMGMGASKPIANPPPSHNTASTEHETNSTAHRGSLTRGSEPRTSSSRNSGENGRQPPSSTYTTSTTSQQNEGKRHGSRRHGGSRRGDKNRHKSHGRRSSRNRDNKSERKGNSSSNTASIPIRSSSSSRQVDSTTNTRSTHTRDMDTAIGDRKDFAERGGGRRKSYGRMKSSSKKGSDR
eukprot:CAMPEP_0113643996 /NCGR_PEP_ID=MMETSP0017_2-20120614/23147_1 /TAXON_ID=2856 /ORGANISM="Cylindrotheca closterium" /LENGTH=739 /DNA_ID=CAMNT_0000555567 /DNA_START=17 /DNA_END=2236 /DNA_ORIENTATION=+ /assembly_acc=CAM_ASM_000147